MGLLLTSTAYRSIAAVPGATLQRNASAEAEEQPGHFWDVASLGSETIRLGVGGAVALVSLAFCFGCAYRARKAEHQYVKQKDDESGMPPEIVGAVGGDQSPGGDTFVIDDVEMWGEDDGIEYMAHGP